ncbi:Chitinase class I [compost metagenome]
MEGKASPALAPETEHWVFVGEMSPTADGDVFLTGEGANDVRASLLPGKGLTVRKEANRHSAAMAVLPVDAQVQLEDGTGSYRKIKSIVASTLSSPLSPECAPNIAGYIHFDSLKAIPQPPTLNTVQTLPTPVPIQAGALIGHLGKYQAASQSEAHDLLHLEVFSLDDVEAFVTQSRARANQLKPEQKTLLKIPSSTKVITKEDATQANPPLISDPGQPTTYDMILPLAVLNALPADKKITLTTTVDGITTTEQWWKLDNLPGEDGNPISGWVKECEIMTPRYHPRDWDGFDFIKETGTLDAMYACKLSADGVLDDGEKTNYQAQINAADSGPIQERLYSIIDRNNDEKLTSAEIKDALAKPGHAQSISRLIVQYESEWYADVGFSKWEALNCYMTKEGETDWPLEKERIKSLLWWRDNPEKLKISETGIAQHINPLSLISTMLTSDTLICKDCGKSIPLDYELFKKIAYSSANQEQLKVIGEIAAQLFKKYKVNSCRQVRHILGQGKVETKGFTAFRESLHYSSYTAQSLYNLAPTAINNGFIRKGITFSSTSEKLDYIKNHLIANDPAYGEHCFGANEHPGKDYRGRGLLHLTHYETYQRCAAALGNHIDSDPDLVQSNMNIAIETGLWFWKRNNIGAIAENQSLTTEEIFQRVTKKINTGLAAYDHRKTFTNEIKIEIESRIGACSK